MFTFVKILVCWGWLIQLFKC